VAETIIFAGTTEFSGGMNASVSPNAISDNQYFLGVNVIPSKAFLGPRWGFTEIELDFTLTGDYTRTTGVKVSYEEIFKSGKFQAFIPYSIGPDYFFIYIVSGFIFLVNLQDLTVTVLNKTDQLNVDADRVNWSSAGNYLVIFDFPNRPFILEGIQIHRSDPALYEVPVSVMGTHNQNRLCIANAGIDWTAGDPAGSVATPLAPVSFQEVLVPSSPYVANVYQVPTSNKNNDFITAMGFLQVQDTSTGIGPLLVATNTAVYSYRTDVPRAAWQGGNNGFVFGSCLLFRDGIVGQRAHVNVGSDLIFRSSDGQVRALSMARNQQQLWGNSPISREVNSLLEQSDPDLAYVSVTSYYQNKIFNTCNPYRVPCYSAEGALQTDFVSSGVLTIELDTTASLSQRSNPVWGGVWTGLHFMDFGLNNQLFYTASKLDGRNRLFLIDKNKTHDTIKGKERYVRSVLLTKGYDNTDITVNKTLHSLDLGLRNIEEKLKVSADYLSGTYGQFIHWKDFTYEAPVEQCKPFPNFANGLVPQGIRDLNLGGVSQVTCNVANNTITAVYKDVQIRLIITGKYWELEYLKLKSVLVPQAEQITYCEQSKIAPVPAQCFDIWQIPESNDCKEE
jgi:hypothetical protein